MTKQSQFYMPLVKICYNPKCWQKPYLKLRLLRRNRAAIRGSLLAMTA